MFCKCLLLFILLDSPSIYTNRLPFLRIVLLWQFPEYHFISIMVTQVRRLKPVSIWRFSLKHDYISMQFCLAMIQISQMSPTLKRAINQQKQKEKMGEISVTYKTMFTAGYMESVCDTDFKATRQNFKYQNQAL